MARWTLAALLAAHAFIHFLGVTRGVMWPLAGVLMLATTVAHVVRWRGFWGIAALSLIASQAAIVTAWADASYGTLANVVVAAMAVVTFFMHGPLSFRAEFERASRAGRARSLESTSGSITEQDLARLPTPVQRYVRGAGLVGRHMTKGYRMHFKGRLRGSPSAQWMPFVVEQQSFAQPPTRLFLMSASMKGLPVQAFHHYGPDGATFRVRLLGLVPIVDAAGPELTKTETVTVFNDMCLLAPATLLSSAITWDSIDEQSARAHFICGDHRITATLYFDTEGQLINFVSDDRSRASTDGKQFTPQRFSTPARSPKTYGGVRLMSFGEARWHAPAPEGEFVYGEFELLDITYDE